MPTKRCPRCRKTKDLEDFGVDRGTNSGRTSHCAACRNVHKRRWAAANPEKVAASQRAWREKNRKRHGLEDAT